MQHHLQYGKEESLMYILVHELIKSRHILPCRQPGRQTDLQGHIIIIHYSCTLYIICNMNARHKPSCQGQRQLPVYMYFVCWVHDLNCDHNNQVYTCIACTMHMCEFSVSRSKLIVPLGNFLYIIHHNNIIQCTCVCGGCLTDGLLFSFHFSFPNSLWSFNVPQLPT